MRVPDPPACVDAILALAPAGRFYDKQGRVHARVSIDFAKECGALLHVPLRG